MARLTDEGVLEAAAEMNERRVLYEKLAVLLESSQKDLARKMIELLYDQVAVGG